MSATREQAARWLEAGRRACVVEVEATRGSVPREVGTRMLVAADHCIGTIGGGLLEWQAIAAARTLLDAADGASRSVDIPLGPALGQCCGGAVRLRYAPLDARSLAAWTRERPRFHLQLYGAGHVGRAIVQALAPLAVTVDWIDEREDEFPEPIPAPGPAGSRARINRICVDGIDAEVRHAPAGACYLVLTHQHELDARITEAILRRADFGFLGLIGSKTKKQRFIHRFERRGIAADVIARMTCPIGIAGIGGKEPEVIAAAVVAQLLQVTGEPGAAAPAKLAPRLATLEA